MLHGVISNEKKSTREWDPLRNHLYDEKLDFVLSVLAKKYNFISLDTAINIIRKKEKPIPYSVVLTFDDGYKNNIINARPILKKYAAPLSIFVVTGHVDKRLPFWFDRFDYVIQKNNLDGKLLKIGDEEFIFKGATRDEVVESYGKIRKIIKGMDSDEESLNKLLNELADNLESESQNKLTDIFEVDDISSILTWDDIVRESKDSDITFGSHTINHIRLNKVTLDIAKEELSESKRAIEEVTETECKYFCYPYGYYTKAIEEITRECGYIAALTTNPGVVSQGDDLMSLNRFPFPESRNPVVIDAIACGLSHKIGSLKQSMKKLFR
jgi:peptidoglycan/xylan/chitin deacetylase (PgdA/CDA1 family)